MRRILLFFGFLSLLLLNYSCKYDTDTLKPKVSGQSGEILLVMTQAQWEAPLGDTIRRIFSHDQPGLPQPEPVFSVIHVTPDQFARIFMTHRNIVNIKIDSKYSEAGMSMANDRWSVPQLIIDITAPNDTSCINLLTTNGDLLTNKINEAERQRVLINYKKYQEADISRKLKKKYGLDLIIPKGYSLDVDSSDFVWIANETPLTSQGILIYFYPYKSEDAFLPDHLIQKRNEFLKRYVKGPVDNTWMTTENLIPPAYSEFEKDSLYFAKLKGLWKLQNGFMGGPFVSISTVDKKKNRVITLEGYVYAPRNKKRELLRQVESIIYSAKILD
jgi:hypothetical protein